MSFGATTHRYCGAFRGLLLAVRRNVDQHELRARIRRFIVSGDLPTISPLSSETFSAPAGIKRISIERSLPDPCVICSEPNPTVAYTYGNGKVVVLHAACDALWRQERNRSMSAAPRRAHPPTPGVLYIECRKREGEPSEYLLSFAGDTDGVGAFYLGQVTGFDTLTALLRKLGVPGPDIATALHVLMAEPRHKIPNVLLTQAMLRDLGL